MANIFDGIERTPKQQIINLKATYDVYTLHVVTKVFICRIINLFKKLFKIYYRPANMAYELEKKKVKLAEYQTDSLVAGVKKSLKGSLRSIGRFKRIKSDDSLSVSIIKALTHIYKSARSDIMSPAEKADELKRKCNIRKASVIKRLPVIWLILSWMILIGTLACLFLIPSWEIVLACGAGAELVNYLFFKRRIAFDRMARAIALSGKYYGEIFSVMPDRITVRNKSNAKNFENGLRALHSIELRIQDNSLKKDDFEVNRKELNNSLQQVESSLRKYSDNGSAEGIDYNDLKNIVKELLQDRARLCEEIKQTDSTIAELNEEDKIGNECYSKLVGILINDIKGFWSGKYSMFSFDDSFFFNLVQRFEWHAYDNIEKRLIELSELNDPTCIGKKKSGFYRFGFGVRGKHCDLRYSIKGSSGKNQNTVVCINALERESPLSDVGMSDKEINETLISYGIINVASVNNDKILQECQKELDETKAKMANLQLDYDNLKENLNKKESELLTLEIDKLNLEKELNKYKQLLENLIPNSEIDDAKKAELIRKIRERISFLEREIKVKEIQYKQVLAENEELLDKFNESKKQLEEALKSIHQLKQQMEELVKEYESEIQSLTDENIALENQNAVISAALESGRIKNQKNTATIIKLKDSLNKSRETSKKQIQKIKELKDKIIEVENRCKELEKTNKDYNDKKREYDDTIAQLLQENERLKSNLIQNTRYEDMDIRKEFFDAFDKARNEIDIVCPWLGSVVERADFREKLSATLCRGVKVKILYGFGDSSGTAGSSFNFKEENSLKETLIYALNNDVNKDEDKRNLRSLKNAHSLHQLSKRICIQNIKNKYSNKMGNLLSKITNTHAKLVIVDDDYYLIGSFNYLSYTANNPKDKRNEIAIKSNDKETLTAFKKNQFSFEENFPKCIVENF